MEKSQNAQRGLKRGEVVVDEIKRWITERNLRTGSKLPQEAELQQMFGVSRGTMREALKVLEVQGLIRLSTGPGGGATVAEVSFDRTFQFLQNFLFFQDMTIGDIYAARRILEPEMAAAAVPHLSEADFAALEASIAICEPCMDGSKALERQRVEDLHFHDILAAACPNPLLSFLCRLINRMLESMVEASVDVTRAEYERLGEASTEAHRRIVIAARALDDDRVRKLMLAHINEIERHLGLVQAGLRSRLVLNSELRLGPSSIRAGGAASSGRSKA